MNLLNRARHRWAAGKVVGHLNVRRCDQCRAWHHKRHHAAAPAVRRRRARSPE